MNRKFCWQSERWGRRRTRRTRWRSWWRSRTTDPALRLSRRCTETTETLLQHLPVTDCQRISLHSQNIWYAMTNFAWFSQHYVYAATTTTPVPLPSAAPQPCHSDFQSCGVDVVLEPAQPLSFRHLVDWIWQSWHLCVIAPIPGSKKSRSVQ